MFGGAPLINSVYHSLALRGVGIDSDTVVWQRSKTWITSDTEWDAVFVPSTQDQPRWRRWYLNRLADYIAFTKLVWDKDVFFYYFDASFFYLGRRRILRWLEVPILKLLGKRVVATPFGQDVVTASDIPDLVRKYVNVRQNRYISTNETLIHKQIRHFTRWADAIIGGLAIGPDHLPRIDYLCPSFFAIDEQKWPAQYGPPRSRGELLRVLHAPNHRHIKGTQFLIDAVEQLQREGLKVELVLMEGMPNSEVKRRMADCHVLTEQFIQGWYGLNGLEGMASGKPVLAYLKPELQRLFSLYSFG
ncbi:MAG: hypothetical protein QGI09_10245, partial [Dehalococcoidia bacterium]|nr:hypothetical protein [Dehalococcoidia bacterium]